MAEVTLSSKNQIVIPKEAREALGAKPGDKLVVTMLGGRIMVLEKPSAASIRGIARGVYPKNYLKKERASWR